MNDLYNMLKMDQPKLNEVIAKFQMPEGEYEISENGEFGESELYWIIENKKEHTKFLLINSYWHPGLEEENNFYRENGFDIKRSILRKPETIGVSENKKDPRIKYLFLFLYAIFELQP